MNRLRTISLKDKDAAQEIIAAAYTLLKHEPIEESAPRPEVIGRSGLCIEASDTVTRAAHKLGIFAAREVHNCHCITAFNPLDTLPSEEDPIICVTWGQFNTPVYDLHLASGGTPAFFGRRKEIGELVHPEAYDRNFSSTSVEYRQVTHAPCEATTRLRDWLLTTPYDLMEAQYPIGETEKAEFPTMPWNIF
jgi:hypothetical protein